MVKVDKVLLEVSKTMTIGQAKIVLEGMMKTLDNDLVYAKKNVNYMDKDQILRKAIEINALACGIAFITNFSKNKKKSSKVKRPK